MFSVSFAYSRIASFAKTELKSSRLWMIIWIKFSKINMVDTLFFLESLKNEFEIATVCIEIQMYSLITRSERRSLLNRKMSEGKYISERTSKHDSHLLFDNWEVRNVWETCWDFLLNEKMCERLRKYQPEEKIRMNMRRDFIVDQLRNGWRVRMGEKVKMKKIIRVMECKLQLDNRFLANIGENGLITINYQIDSLYTSIFNWNAR